MCRASSPPVTSFICRSCGAVGVVRFCPSCGAELMIEGDPADPRIGTVVAGRYDVLEEIGRGGMGRVYRARQRSLGRDVAIKFVHGHLLHSQNVVERFMAEARSVSRLNHPNVVSVYDFGRANDREG